MAGAKSYPTAVSSVSVHTVLILRATSCVLQQSETIKPIWGRIQRVGGGLTKIPSTLLQIKGSGTKSDGECSRNG